MPLITPAIEPAAGVVILSWVPTEILPAATKDVPEPAAELIAFYQRLRKNLGREDITVTVEPKIDGVAVSLLYRDGKLAYAATRGDEVH